MGVPFDVLWTDEFQIAWGKFSYELEDSENANEIDEKILAAISRLEDSGPEALVRIQARSQPILGAYR